MKKTQPLTVLQPAHNLTPKQEAFARAYVQHHGNLQKTADYMGLKNRDEALEIYREKGVGFAIRNEQLRLLSNHGATLAVNTLVQILENPEEKSKIKLEAAKTILDRVGISTRIAPEATGGLQRLAEMSITELEAEVTAMRNRAAELSRPVIDGKAEVVASQPGADAGMCEPC